MTLAVSGVAEVLGVCRGGVGEQWADGAVVAAAAIAGRRYPM